MYHLKFLFKVSFGAMMVMILLFYNIPVFSQSSSLIDFATADWNGGSGWDDDCDGGLTNPQVNVYNGITVSVYIDPTNDNGEGSECGQAIVGYNSVHTALNSYADSKSSTGVRNLVRIAKDDDQSIYDPDPGEESTGVTITFSSPVLLRDFLFGAIHSYWEGQDETLTVTFYDAISGGDIVSADMVDTDPLGDGNPSTVVQNSGTYTVTPTGINTQEDVEFQVTTTAIQRIELSFTTEHAQTGTSEIGSMGMSGGFTIENSPIAVELISFTSTVAEGDVHLLWKTESEAGMTGYNVYRCTHENDRYEKINSAIIAAQNDPIENQYHFVDSPPMSGIYYYKLQQVEIDGTVSMHGPIMVNVETSVDSEPLTIHDYHLYGNYPNPFNPETTIRFDLPEANHVSLLIYDMHGRQIKQLRSGLYTAGRYDINWDATNQSGEKVSSGLYHCKLQAGEYSATHKMLLLK